MFSLFKCARFVTFGIVWVPTFVTDHESLRINSVKEGLK
jgi:hypothetical protein